MDQVAGATGISRRTLDRHFRASLGRSVNEEFLHRRLGKARELLATTEMPAADVAARAGFHSAQYFTLAFKRALGVTPRRYREKCRML